MPRVNKVEKARKDIFSYSGKEKIKEGKLITELLDEDFIVRKGESYFWWKFRFGSKQVSKTAPRRQQLTQSEFFIAVYDFEDELSNLIPNADIESDIDSIVESINSLADEQEDKIGNLPENLQNSGPTYDLLTNRADSLRDWASEIESAKDSNLISESEDIKAEIKEENSKISDEELADKVTSKITEEQDALIQAVQETSYSGE